MTDERCAPCVTAEAERRAEERRAYRGRRPRSGARHHKRRALYDSRAWREVRALVIQRDGACQLCGTTERLTAHHIHPAADDDARALDMDNLVALCRRCHGRVDGGKAEQHKRAARAREALRPRKIGGR